LRSITLLIAVVATGAGGASASAATVRHPHVGKLPGFPAIRGVVPVLSSEAAVSAHERLVRGAFAEARKHHASAPAGAPVENIDELAPCTQPFEKVRSAITQAACYRGGPVLHDTTVHVIFWQGPLEGLGNPTNPKVSLFPIGYPAIIKAYFEGVAKESGAQTNVFAVDPQYFEEKSGLQVPGEYKLAFEPNADVAVDTTHVFPAHSSAECTDKAAEGPCILDADIQQEVTQVAAEHTSPAWPTGNLSNIYLVLTPPGVGSCRASGSSECSYTVFCAYHGDFGGNGMTPGEQTIYANLPFIGKIRGCDTEVHPNEGVAEDHGADALIDTASHELNEAVTDPIGSQCEEEAGKIVGCERNAWTDMIGQEIGDKCVGASFPLAGPNSSYGEPLGELVAGKEASRYNQVINGHEYWTQKEWSNEAGGFYKEQAFEGGCVQRMIGAPFVVGANASATVPTTLNAAAAGAPGDPAVYWIWNFGDGEQVGTSSATVAHKFAVAGKYEVALSAFDAFGSSEGHVMEVKIGPPPPPVAPSPPPPTSTSTTTTTTGSVSPPVARYSSAQVAAKLGLPRAGAKLPGLGTIVFGHGGCPPACLLSVRLVTRVTTSTHHRHVTKTVQIGIVSLTIASGGTGTIALKLGSTGRSLLRRQHTLSVQLQLTVWDQEGGSWPVSRAFTLTASGSKSARPRQ
jgi:hypothetical protein